MHRNYVTGTYLSRHLNGLLRRGMMTLLQFRRSVGANGHKSDVMAPEVGSGGATDDAEDDDTGHWKEFPESSMSLMSVSMGVFPTRRTKKSCSMTEGETVRREGSRSRSLPKRVGWFGYWLRQYSSSAHCDFS